MSRVQARFDYPHDGLGLCLDPILGRSTSFRAVGLHDKTKAVATPYPRKVTEGT
jgi:hypothetical protein